MRWLSDRAGSADLAFSIRRCCLPHSPDGVGTRVRRLFAVQSHRLHTPCQRFAGNLAITSA